MLPPILLQQAAPLATTPWWIEAIRSPAAVIFSLTVCTKFVIMPAVSTYIRHELQAELKQIAEFPLFVDRVERIERTIEALGKIPEQLGRIEEQVRALHRDIEASA